MGRVLRGVIRAGPLRYVLTRLAFYLVAAWVALTVAFFLPRLMPGDPATAMFARFQGKLQPESIAAMREALGLADDASLGAQYASYLGHVLDGDFGVSATYFPAPVGDVIAGGLGWTVLVVGVAVVIAFVLGTALGVLAAWRRGGVLDRVAPPALALLGAFPYFWLAMLMLFLFGFALGWAPLGHAHSPHLAPELSLTFIADVAAHAALPVTSIVLATLGGWMLTMRGAMVTVLGQDYVRLAHAKGLAPRRVMLRYAAKNALLPSVTSFGMALGFVVGGSLLTEIVFAYPGQGYLLVQAVKNQDYPLMQGIFVLITLSVLVSSFVVDLVQLALDPRTRR